MNAALCFVSFLSGAALTGVILLSRKLRYMEMQIDDLDDLTHNNSERLLDLEKEVY